MRREEIDAGPDVTRDEEVAGEVELHERITWHRAKERAARQLLEDQAAHERADVERARPLVAGQSFPDGMALYVFLHAKEKAAAGRPLSLSETHRLRRAAGLLWRELSSDEANDHHTTHTAA